MNQSNLGPPDGDSAMPNRETILALAEELIQNKKSKIPDRVHEYLDTLREGLQRLVEEKIAVKVIHERYVRKFPWKISLSQVRQYLQSEFGYPPPTNKRPAAKTKQRTAQKSAARKSAARKTTSR